MSHLVFLPLVNRGRPRPHKGHISQKHIEKLRKFINGGLSYKPAYTVFFPVRAGAYDPRIILHLEHKPLHLIILHKLCLALFRIPVHAPEFQHSEYPAVLSHSLLGEKDWAGIGDEYQWSHKYRKKQGYYKSNS